MVTTHKIKTQKSLCLSQKKFVLVFVGKLNKQLQIPSGTLVQYVRKDVPEDQINCNPIKCLNTGTLYVNPAEKKASVKFQVRADADDFALGFNMILYQCS